VAVVKAQSLVSLPDSESLSESIKVDGVIAGGVVPAPNNAILRKKLAECGERAAWLSGRSRCIACPGLSISCARGFRRNGLDHIHPQYEYQAGYRYYLPVPKVVGSVPIFIEENRRDISELELRFAEVSGFLSVVATTVRGNAAAKDLSTAENIIRPEVLRLVFLQAACSRCWCKLKKDTPVIFWSLWISMRQIFLKYRVSIILPM
jgi:hypothetical protein